MSRARTQEPETRTIATPYEDVASYLQPELRRSSATSTAPPPTASRQPTLRINDDDDNDDDARSDAV